MNDPDMLKAYGWRTAPDEVDPPDRTEALDAALETLDGLDAEPDPIKWGAPPPVKPRGGGRSTGGVWSGRLAPFRKQPGAIGKLPGRWHGGTAGRLVAGYYKGVGAGSFLAANRNYDAAGLCEIWVCYVRDLEPDTITDIREAMAI